MYLRHGGIDSFYIDESHDKTLYAVTAIAVPFLRQSDALWRIAWPDHYAAAKAWRARIAATHKIPTSKELHGTNLVSGRGNYLYGRRQIRKEDAAEIYHKILGDIDFVPPESIITVVGSRGPQMYGHQRLERVMYALFQRMRSQCVARSVNALTFFDEGHPEYRRLYRKARVHLPTGSRFGGDRNLPLDMFIEDGNAKDSKHCVFTQAADLISYAALAKVRHEMGLMDAAQTALNLHWIYAGLPNSIKNLKAGGADGIKRLG